MISQNSYLIHVKKYIINIILAYFNPHTTPEVILDVLSEALKSIQNNERIILAGDFNSRTDQECKNTRILLSYTQANNLHMLNNENKVTYHSWNGSSTIDLIFTNSQDLLIKTEIIKYPGKKHCIVETTWKFNGKTNLKPSLNTIRRVNFDKIKSEFYALNIHTYSTSKDVDCICNCLQNILKKSMIINTNNRKTKPWYNTELKQLKSLILNCNDNELLDTLQRKYRKLIKYK